jgi:hypothetical protein
LITPIGFEDKNLKAQTQPLRRLITPLPGVFAQAFFEKACDQTFFEKACDRTFFKNFAA